MASDKRLLGLLLAQGRPLSEEHLSRVLTIVGSWLNIGFPQKGKHKGRQNLRLTLCGCATETTYHTRAASHPQKTTHPGKTRDEVG